MAQVIALVDLQQNLLLLPLKQARAPRLADAREMQAVPGQALDLRGILAPGSVVSWSGQDLVIQSPAGEVLVVRQALQALAQGGIVVLLALGAEQHQLLLSMHDGQPALKRSFVLDAFEPYISQLSQRLPRDDGKPYRAPDRNDERATWTDDYYHVHATQALELAARMLFDKGVDLSRQVGNEVLGWPEQDAMQEPAAMDESRRMDRREEVPLLDLPPVAQADVLQAVEDGGPFVLNVLNNDYDPDFASDGAADLVLLEVWGGSNGVLSFNAQGEVSYTPAANFFGTEFIFYRVADRTGKESIGQLVVTVQGVDDPPALDAGAGVGVLQQVVFRSGDASVKPFASLKVTEPDGDALASARMERRSADALDAAEQIGIDGVYYALNVAQALTNARGDVFTFDGNGNIDIAFAANTSAAQAQTVLGELVYKHAARPPAMQDRQFLLTVTDANGTPARQPAVVNLDAEPSPRLTQANLAFSPMREDGLNQFGVPQFTIDSEMDWQAGDVIRVTWYDNSSPGFYDGDGNSGAGLNIDRVEIDLSVYGMGKQLMVNNSGVWICDFTLPVLPALADPGRLLAQVNARVFVMDGGVEYSSPIVAVNRIVLSSTAAVFAEGTAGDDVFMLVERLAGVGQSAFGNFAHQVNGGNGFDELDLTRETQNLRVDANAFLVSLANQTGLDTVLLSIERIRVALQAGQTLALDVGAPGWVDWVASGSDTLARIDLDGNGDLDGDGVSEEWDLEILYVGQSMAAAKLATLTLLQTVDQNGNPVIQPVIW